MIHSPDMPLTADTGFKDCSRRPSPGRRTRNARTCEAEAAGQGCGHPRLDLVSRPLAQRGLDRNAAEPHAPAAARLGASERHRLRVAGHRRRSPVVPASDRRRGDRRMPAPRNRRPPVGVPLSHRLRGSLRLQQRPAVEPGRRRRPRLHRRRAGPAALPGLADGTAASGGAISPPNTRCRRTSSAPRRLRSSKARC